MAGFTGLTTSQDLDISHSDRLKTSYGRELMQEMERNKFVSRDNVYNLPNLLKRKPILEGAERVKRFKQSQNDEDMSTKGKMNKTKFL